MRSTERNLRLLIREEILREQQSWIPYSGEKSAQDLSTLQQVGYAAARGILDTTPAGARHVAQGNVDFKFTTYWDLPPAHKKIITDGLETLNNQATMLSVAFPPAAVVPVAAGIVSAALKASDGDAAGGVQDLLGAVLVGLLTGPKVADVLTKYFGARIAAIIGKEPSKFLRAVFGDGASLMPEIREALAKLGGATDLQAAVRAGYKGSAMARGAGFILKAIITGIFNKIDGAIASILVKLPTVSGRANLVASYNQMKAQVLAAVENPAGNPVLTNLLAKAERIVAAA